MTHLTKTEERIVEAIRAEPCIHIKTLAHKLDSTPGSIRTLMHKLRAKGVFFRQGLVLEKEPNR